jgi:DNA (cytosine-5)-methyltransferase 1
VDGAQVYRPAHCDGVQLVRFLSLFAGIGGFDLGLERAGHECAGQVEIDPFCRRVLAQRFNAPAWADVREWRSYGDECIELLCGGFPCQDLSTAGNRAGLAGERSGLFWEIVRIAKEIRPRYGVFENVPGLLSSHDGRDLGLVVQGLRQCFTVVGFRVLDSQYFGVAQRRRRMFLVGGHSEEAVASVLFEPELQVDAIRRTARVDGVRPPYEWMLDDEGKPTSPVQLDNARYLTPLECERLQGFPDGWTCLCLPLEVYERDPDEAAMLCKCPDSPRYRALGNAVTVNVVRWLGERLAA